MCAAAAAGLRSTKTMALISNLGRFHDGVSAQEQRASDALVQMTEHRRPIRHTGGHEGNDDGHTKSVMKASATLW